MNPLKRFFENIAATETEAHGAVHERKMQHLEDFDVPEPSDEEASDEEIEELRRLAPSLLGEGRRWVH